MSMLIRVHLLTKGTSTALRNFSSQATSSSADVLVNGGGIVGLTFIASLAKSPNFAGKKILLLEQQNPPSHSQTENIQSERNISNRVSSLTTSSIAFFNQLGIWNDIEKYVKKVDKMHVWSESFSRAIVFDSVAFHRPSCRWDAPQDDAVCYFIENNVLQDALQSVIPKDVIRYSCQATDIQEENGRLSVKVDHDGSVETVSTSLLVGCDGFRSFVRGKSNLQYREIDWHESAIVATVEMDAKSDYDENTTAYQRFLPEDGSVVALLPLTKVHSSLVVSTNSTKANYLVNLEEEQFVDELNSLLSKPSKNPIAASEPFASVISTVESLAHNLSTVLAPGVKPFSSTGIADVPQVRSIISGSRASFPLYFGTTLPFMTGSLRGSKVHRIALIGDSCHRIPPLAGQGLNLGIGDAIQLAESLNSRLSRGENIFSNQPESHEAMSQLLSEFERIRLVKLLPMVSSVATMQKVFQYTPSQLVSLANQLSQLKNFAVRFANSR